MIVMTMTKPDVHNYMIEYYEPVNIGETSVAGITPLLDLVDDDIFIPVDVPLDSDIQEYLYDRCDEDYDKFKKMLAIIGHESRYDADATGYNKNGTYDMGLVQINSRYWHYYEDLYCMTIDPYNPYDAINFLIAKMDDEYNYWSARTSGDYIYYSMLGSYNMGRASYKNKLFNNGRYTYDYTERVLAVLRSL